MPDIDPVYEGHGGLRRFFRDFSERWETISVDVEDVVDVQDARRLVAAHSKERVARGSSST